MHTVALVVALAGCRPPEPLPPRTGAASYGVAVASASGDRTVTSVYDLEVRHADGDVWTFATTRSEGTWDEGLETLAYDSAAPAASDPWPLQMQHAVASVPAAIRLEGGAPVALIDEEGWRDAAQAALLALPLPADALASGATLVDPAGIVRDLRRNFPGTPPEGAWRRAESIAGLPSTRVETCVRAHAGAITTWTCAGTIEGPSGGQARLYEATSQTVVEADAKGLRRMETQYAATMVLLDPELERVVDRPVAGRRLVQRR